MDELTIQQLIQVKFSGELEQTSMYVNIAIQAIAVLIGGIVVWRASNAYHKKKQKERQRNTFFETPYSREWRKK